MYYRLGLNDGSKDIILKIKYCRNITSVSTTAFKYTFSIQNILCCFCKPTSWPTFWPTYYNIYNFYLIKKYRKQPYLFNYINNYRTFVT